MFSIMVQVSRFNSKSTRTMIKFITVQLSRFNAIMLLNRDNIITLIISVLSSWFKSITLLEPRENPVSIVMVQFGCIYTPLKGGIYPDLRQPVPRYEIGGAACL